MRGPFTAVFHFNFSLVVVNTPRCAAVPQLGMDHVLSAMCKLRKSRLRCSLLFITGSAVGTLWDWFGFFYILARVPFYGCCASQSRDDKCLTLLVSSRANLFNPEICTWICVRLRIRNVAVAAAAPRESSDCFEFACFLGVEAQKGRH